MRLIEIDALKETLDKIPARSIENADGRVYVLIRLSTVLEIIKQLPSAQPERKKGRWIRNDNGTYSCSICQSWIPEEQHHYARYCLYCGADMREG